MTSRDLEAKSKRPLKSLQEVAARVRDPVKSNVGQSRNLRKSSETQVAKENETP